MTKLLSILFTLSAFSLYAEEKGIYKFKWMEEDQQLFILQKKSFPKDGKLFLDLGYVSSQLSDFQDSSGQQIEFSYFFSEEWGVSMGHVMYQNSDNESYDSVSSQTNEIPFVRRLTSRTYADILYSPFYGKLNTYNWIYYIDLSLGLGVSSITAEDNRNSFLNNTTLAYESQSYTGIDMLVKVKFYITNNYTASITFNRTYFNALRPKPTETEYYYNVSDVIFNLGYRF